MTLQIGPRVEVSQRPLRPLLSNQRFLALWLAQLLSQIAQNAMLFTLLIVVIRHTGSSTPAAGLLLMIVAPSLLFGISAGVLTDRIRPGVVLVTTSCLRSATAFTLFLVRGHVELLLPFTFLWSSVSQFFPPAAMAAVPSLVLGEQLMAANSFFTFANTGAQLLGLVIVAPAIVKLFGTGAVFLVASGCYLIAAVLTLALYPRVLTPTPTRPQAEGIPVIRSMVQEFTHAFALLRQDAASAVAMVHLTIGSTLVMVFAVLMPLYMTHILASSPDDAVFVFAPTGLGALIGLRAVPWLGARLRPSRIVATGHLGIALALTGFALVERVALVMQQHDVLNPAEHLGGRSLLVVLAMLLAGPLGVAYALVNAPAQTLLHQRAPQALRGRVFATQLVIANLGSLLPLFVLGALADMYGVNTVILMIAGLLALSAVMTLLWRGEPPALAPAADRVREIEVR